MAARTARRVRNTAAVQRWRADRRVRNTAAVRRWRARQKKCQGIVNVVYDGRVLAMLINRNYIAEAEADDADEIAEPLQCFSATTRH